MDGPHPWSAGQWHVFFDGTGSITMEGNGVSNQVLAAPGEITFDFRGLDNDQMFLEIRETTFGDHIHNIRVIHEDELTAYNGGQRMRQLWLDYIGAATNGPLRFVHMLRSYESPVVDWADRTGDEASWSTLKGTPPELIVTACNEANRDCWVNIPYQASDDYVSNFASYIAANLNGGLTCYVEYACEIWNTVGDFSAQHQYAEAQGTARGFGTGYGAALQFYGARSKEIFALFETAFGGLSRLCRVVMTHNANPWVTDQTLSGDNVYQETDVLAIAPYFRTSGVAQADILAQQWTTTQLLDELRRDMNERAIPQAVEQKSKAEQYGLQLMCYEGGQHLVVEAPLRSDPFLHDLFTAVNVDPEMGVIYSEYLAALQELGVTTFCHHSETQYGGIHGLLGRASGTTTTR